MLLNTESIPAEDSTPTMQPLTSSENLSGENEIINLNEDEASQQQPFVSSQNKVCIFSDKARKQRARREIPLHASDVNLSTGVSR